mgnify:FL=1
MNDSTQDFNTIDDLTQDINSEETTEDTPQMYGLKINSQGRIIDITGYFEGCEKNFPILVDHLPNGSFVNFCWRNGDYVEVPVGSLEYKKESVREKMSMACQSAIEAGVDVEVSTGTEHFSLDSTDQMNLTNMNILVAAGVAGYPYHADGKACRVYTADEITKIATAATQWVTANTTLNNSLVTWINRIETEEELNTVEYSVNKLPDDLKKAYNAIVSGASSSDDSTDKNSVTE